MKLCSYSIDGSQNQHKNNLMNMKKLCQTYILWNATLEKDKLVNSKNKVSVLSIFSFRYLSLNMAAYKPWLKMEGFYLIK